MVCGGVGRAAHRASAADSPEAQAGAAGSQPFWLVPRWLRLVNRSPFAVSRAITTLRMEALPRVSAVAGTSGSAGAASYAYASI
ncbi:hypothetical protein [Streptomyces sp. NPDC001851]|uniref:hypothetical protein n=1 Tax=Streptomyces sp. NPDC001851 TaxID=3154529 RepID=UPI00331C1127